MELLELLEERIQALIAEVQKLRKDNNTLRDDLSSYAALIEQYKSQALELNQQKENAEHAKRKIEALLEKVQNAISE